MIDNALMVQALGTLRLPSDYVIVDLSDVKHLTVTIPAEPILFGDEQPLARRTYIEGDGIPKIYIDHAGQARGQGYILWVGYSEFTNTLFYRVQKDPRGNR